MLRSFYLIFITIAIFFSACQESGQTDTSLNGVDSVDPTSFTFASIYNAEINNEYTSNEITVEGLADDITVKITITDGSLIVNGSEIIGDYALVSNGSKVAVKLKSSSSYGLTKSTSVTLGNYSTSFVIETAEDKIVNTFTFNDISDAGLSKEYLSNKITISGLGTGISVDAVITGGSLIHNGNLIGENNITVTNGDELSIVITSNADYSSTKESTLAIGNVQDTFSVTTFPDVTNVALSPSTSTIEVGSSTVLSFTVTPSNAPSGVIYTSSSNAVATVSPTGVVTGVAVGISTISATSTYNNTKIATSIVNVVSVLPSVAPTSITVSPSLIVLAIDDNMTLDALPFPSGSSENLIWGSSDSSVVVVDDDGNISAVSPGKAIITAYSNEDMKIKGSTTVYVEIYENLEQIGHKDTIGSVVDIEIDSNATTLFMADSAPGVKAYTFSFEGNSSDMNGSVSEIGALDVPATTEAIFLSADDETIYLANGYNGFREINVSNPASLVETKSYTHGYQDNYKFAADAIVSADKSKAFVATEKGLEWLVLDTNITTNDEVNLTTGTSYKVDLTSDDKKVLLASGSGGLNIYDVVGSKFDVTATYNYPASSNCKEIKDIEISKDDRNIYIGCSSGLIEIINIENLSAIKLKGTYKTSQQIESILLSNDEDRLYVSNGTMGLIVLDVTFYNTITELIEPRAVSAFNTVGFVKDIELTQYSSKDILITGDGGNGLLMLK